MRSLLSQNRILGGAAVLSILQLTASLAGLVRDRVLAQTFPGLSVVDVYIASFRPSDLLFQMLIMSAFSVALVPLLARHFAEKDTQEMGKLLGSVMGLGSLLFGAIAVVIALFFDSIAPSLTNFEGESLRLYITFGRLALLTNGLFVLGNAFGQYLITVQRYWIYGLTPVLYTLGTIGGTLWLTPHFGAFGPMYGTMIGAVLYILVRGAAVLRHGCTIKLSLWHSDIPEMMRLMVPRVCALGILQLQLLLFDTIASGLPAGSVTVNAYARNVQAALVGLTGIALAQSTYSLLSQAAAKNEWKRYGVYLKKGIVVLLVLTIPGSVLTYFLAPVVGVVFSLHSVLGVFALCLGMYAFSIPFESVNHLLLRGFYALKETRIPAVLSVLNGCIAIAVSWKLSATYGVVALALGFAAGQVVQCVLLSVVLWRLMVGRGARG